MNKKTNSIDVDQLDRDAVKQKLANIFAQANGDKQRMERAAAQANEDYKAGAPHTAGEDTAATKALKNYYEQVDQRYSLYKEAILCPTISQSMELMFLLAIINETSH